MRRDFPFLFLALLLALAVRLDLLIANNFVVDADEAIVGLMARHIVLGHPLPVFYYGQHYMGSLEAILVAIGFRLFGESAVVLKGVPLLFSLLFVFLTYAVAHQLGGKTAARIAALLAAIPPSALVVWSSMARGGFIEIVVIAAFAILLTLRWMDDPKPRLLFSLHSTAMIAAVLGLGWWVNNQIIYAILPIAFVMGAAFVRDPARFYIRAVVYGLTAWALISSLLWVLELFGVQPLGWWATSHIVYVRYGLLISCALAALTTAGRPLITHGITGAVFFLLGGAPFWLYNLTHSFASFGMFGKAKAEEIGQHAVGLGSQALPILFGAKRFWADEDLFPGSSLFIMGLYTALLMSYLVLRWRDLLALASFRVKKPEVLFLYFLCCCLIFVVSSFGWLVQAPRYLLPAYLALFTLTGFILAQASPKVRNVCVAVLLGLNLFSSYPGLRALPGEPYVFKGERVSKDQSELIHWLSKNNISWVRTNYWIGYRLAFETKEQVRFLVFQEPQQTRIKEYELVGQGQDRAVMPLVLVPSQAVVVRRALGKLGYSFDETRLSGYVVIHSIVSPTENLTAVPKDLLSISATAHVEASALAIDGSSETRWGSAEPQRPGMEVRIALKAPRTLRAISYDLGLWPQDYPRGFEVAVEAADGTTHVVMDSSDWWAVRYYAGGQGPIVFRFEPLAARAVVMRQVGSDPIFDWSIAEAGLFE